MELSQTLDYVPLMKATLQAALAGVTFGALGFALGAFTGKSSMAWAFGGGLMAFEYLTNSLAEQMNSLNGLMTISHLLEHMETLIKMDYLLKTCYSSWVK